MFLVYLSSASFWPKKTKINSLATEERAFRLQKVFSNGTSFITPNPTFEKQRKPVLLGFLGFISSWWHELQEVTLDSLQPDPPLLCSHSDCGLPQKFKKLKSWRVLKEYFLSIICPDVLVGSSGFLSRTDTKLVLRPPWKLQSMLQTPAINPNTQKIILFSHLHPYDHYHLC